MIGVGKMYVRVSATKFDPETFLRLVSPKPGLGLRPRWARAGNITERMHGEKEDAQRATLARARPVKLAGKYP